MIDVKGALLNLGERCLKLADQLDSSGRELNPDENQLIRMAGLPALREAQDMLMTAYLTGNQDYVDYNLKHITDMVKDFI